MYIYVCVCCARARTCVSVYIHIHIYFYFRKNKFRYQWQRMFWTFCENKLRKHEKKSWKILRLIYIVSIFFFIVIKKFPKIDKNFCTDLYMCTYTYIYIARARRKKYVKRSMESIKIENRRYDYYYIFLV